MKYFGLPMQYLTTWFQRIGIGRSYPTTPVSYPTPPATNPRPKPAYVQCSISPCLHYLLSGAALSDVYATFYISLVIIGSSSTDTRTWQHRKRGYPACWMILSWVMLSAYVCSILLGHSFNTWNATARPFCYDPFPPELPFAPPESEDKKETPWESEWDPDDLYASYYHRYVHQLGYGAEFDELCSHEGARSILIDSLFDEDFSHTASAPTTAGSQCAAASLQLGVDEITDSIRLTSSCSAATKYSRLKERFDLIVDTGASISITHDIRDFVGPLVPLSLADSTVSGLSTNVRAQGIGMIVWNLHVLKNENVMKNEINKSSPRSLTVLHALGSQVRKSNPVDNVTGKPAISLRTKSWAEVVSHR
jgi:hypothetical protein